MTIHEKIKELLSDIAIPVIFELGANTGQDTKILADIENSTVFAFECDDRCFDELKKLKVILCPLAIAAHTGFVEFTPSVKYGDQEWNCSGSIHKPKNHFKEYPSVTFGEPVKIPCITLDSFCFGQDVDHIDLIWADLQGAEEDFILGAKDMLKNTKYLYTEYSDTETYENQITLKRILELLPTWCIVEKYKDSETNVLLKNCAL